MKRLNVEDGLHLVASALLLLFILGTMGCASGTGSEQGASARPGPIEPQPDACPIQPTSFDVTIKNHLLGQVIQIGTGANGWAAIGNDNLILHCTGTGSTIVCDRYAAEPSTYDFEVVP